MKQKGTSKQVHVPNFWGEKESQIDDGLKGMVYEQYLSQDTLYVYCDCAINSALKQMAVACTYVSMGSIIVKQQYVYPPGDCVDKPIFAEIKAVIFALSHFDKHTMPDCKNVIIYSDVDDIEAFLHNRITFKKNASLKKLQSEMILLYQKMQKKHPNISIDIKYLQQDKKIHNPFHRSSHNSANKMLNKKMK